MQRGSFTAHYHPGSLLDAIREIIDLVESTIDEKDITIQLNLNSLSKADCHVKFDKRRLQQVILNLLSNAVKFVSSGPVVVDVNIIDEVNDDLMLKIAVSDSGLGISKDD